MAEWFSAQFGDVTAPHIFGLMSNV